MIDNTGDRVDEHQIAYRHNGFLVIRLPEKLVDPYHVSVMDLKNSRRIRYRGIDRIMWDFLENRDRHILPVSVQTARLHVVRSNNLFGIDVCDDLDAANELLAFANSNQLDYELVAIRSRAFESMNGFVTLFSQNIHWIGFDCISLGWWSLLREGIFLRPDAFPEWIEFLGPEGLFAHSNTIESYAKAYEVNAGLGLVEPIPTGMIYSNQPINVGSLCSIEIGIPY